VLAVAAATLRVLPSVIGTSLGPDERNAMLLTAGLLAEAAILLFAYTFARLVLRRA
jgi:hypothetical protein